MYTYIYIYIYSYIYIYTIYPYNLPRIPQSPKNCCFNHHFFEWGLQGPAHRRLHVRAQHLLVLKQGITHFVVVLRWPNDDKPWEGSKTMRQLQNSGLHPIQMQNARQIVEFPNGPKDTSPKDYHFANHRAFVRSSFHGNTCTFHKQSKLICQSWGVGPNNRKNNTRIYLESSHPEVDRIWTFQRYSHF